MDRNIALEFVRATEAAAIASARWLGRGDKNSADDAAVKEMRSRMNDIEFKGRVVIGEGERDEAPMLFIGEELGKGGDMEFDIAVDPLEGTSITARGGNNALSVLAAAPKGTLLHAPDLYMNKIAVGPRAKGKVHLDKSVTENVNAVAEALGKDVSEITVIVLDRPRHDEIVKELRSMGARIKLIQDGDVAGALAPSMPGSGVDMLLGVGAAPEGVIAAAGLKCLGGEIQGRLVFKNDEQIERTKKMGYLEDPNQLLTIADMVKSDNAVFVATGVSDGTILKGVQFHQDVITTHSIVMRAKSGTVRTIETYHKPKDN